MTRRHVRTQLARPLSIQTLPPPLYWLYLVLTTAALYAPSSIKRSRPLSARQVAAKSRSSAVSLSRGVYHLACQQTIAIFNQSYCRQWDSALPLDRGSHRACPSEDRDGRTATRCCCNLPYFHSIRRRALKEGGGYRQSAPAAKSFPYGRQALGPQRDWGASERGRHVPCHEHEHMKRQLGG